MKRSLILAISLAFLGLSGLASARPRVALVVFEGDPGGAAQQTVSDALGDDVEVVGPKQVNRTVDKLGLDAADLGDKDLKKLASELDAEAIVQAKLTNKGGTHQLRFRLFVHGKKQKGFKIDFASMKSAKFKAKLHDKMLEKLGIESKSSDDDDAATPVKKKKGDDADAAPSKKKKGDDDDASSSSSSSKKKKGGDSDDDSAALKPKKGGGDDDDSQKKSTDDDAEAPHHKGPKHVAHGGDDDDLRVEAHADDTIQFPVHAANRVAVRLDVGGSVTQRSLKFTSRAFAQAPKGYSDSPVPGLRIEGQIYPLAFGDPKAAIAGLGLGGSFDDTPSLNLTSTAQPGTNFPATERRYGIGPRFRVVFGPKDTSPSMTIGVDYGHRTFTVNRSALMNGNIIDLPDVDYRGVTTGVELRFPVAPHVAVLVSGQAILLTGAGPIQDLTSYGQARVTGGQGSAGLDFVITNRFAVRVTADFAQLGLKFTGNGALSNDRDGDPSQQDVGGATDRYIGGAATLAVLY